MSTEGTLLWASQLPIIIPPIDSSYLVVRDFSLPLSDVERDAEFKPPGRRVQLEALGGGECGGVGFLLVKTFSLPS
jgi:hypothetical protein